MEVAAKRKKDAMYPHTVDRRRAGRRYLIGFAVALLVPLAAAPAGAKLTVSVEFDDGFASAYQAKSILASHGMHATFYINTNGTQHPDYMTWDQLQDLEQDGNEIGGHTLDHLNLSTLSPEEQRHQ